MGCCLSSPHAKRRYRDPADQDEEIVLMRTFGTWQAGSVLNPDDLGALPSVHLPEHLSSNSNELLYAAETDHGRGFRCIRFKILCCLTPFGWAWILQKGVSASCKAFSCDEACCWVRKEYSTRSFFHVYPNRIVINQPAVRFPFGYCGCGSWNADHILTHSFDRGAFGFSRVSCLTHDHLCCLWPVYGGVVARHRCSCNGPVWNRCFTDCGGCWCEEWLCQVGFCSYRYTGLADPDEVVFACSIALQAYFEGRSFTRKDMEKCLEFWRNSISERHDPLRRKRPVCLEPFYVPSVDGTLCYKCTHPVRNIPYGEEKVTVELKEVYGRYAIERKRQIERYGNFTGPVRHSTICRMAGCRRFFGRKGVCFCTEGCTGFNRKGGEPAPPLQYHDFDDDFDASTVLKMVIGPPPKNVKITRWRWDAEKKVNVLETFPSSDDKSGNDKFQSDGGVIEL